MNKFVMVGSIVTCFLLGACTSSRENSLVRADHNVVDSERVAAVNAASLRTGVQVNWVNPPVKRVPIRTGLAD